MERGHIQGLPNFWGYPLLSQERVKLRTSNFVGTFIGSIGTKAHKNVGNSDRGRSQEVPKIFRAPICRAHCAVIFAIAQLSCWFRPPNAQNLLPKICTKLPISRLVWQIDRRCLGQPGGWPIQWNHLKCCGADLCCHGNEMWARCGDPFAYRLV